MLCRLKLGGPVITPHGVVCKLLLRYAMQARPMSSCGVRLSVSVSVTFMDNGKTNKHIIKMFSPSGSHAILVFTCQTSKRHSNIPTGTPLTGASNSGGVGRNRDFEPISGQTRDQQRFTIS